MSAYALTVAGGVVAGLALVWLALVAALWLSRPGEATAREALRLLPDLVRLLRRLAGDDTLPRAVRVWLWLGLGYLLLPIDLVPDFVPVLGYADDAVVLALVLRAVVRRAGQARPRPALARFGGPDSTPFAGPAGLPARA